MNDFENYKKLQESFVSNQTGTNPSEISLVLNTTVLSVLLRKALLLVLGSDAVTTSKRLSIWSNFTLDFIFLILPTLLSATAMSESLIFLHFCMISIATVAILIHMYGKGFNWNQVLNRLSDFPSMEMNGKIDFICNFKAYTLIGTVISILAVDFTVYPRRFCKTETYGTGLMDAGVGLFIVSNAIVSPEARSRIFLKNNSIPILMKSVASSIPLLILGFARVLATKGVNYQEHVTEYGTHWNFFFTLAVVKIFCSYLSDIVEVRLWKFIIILMCILYQYILTSAGISQYIIKGMDGHGGRHGLLDSNREGIISSLGYFILYMFGVEIGRYIFKKERSIVKDYLHLLCVLLLSTVLAFSVLPFITQIESVSRRFANVSYIVWMLGICLQLLVSYLFVDILFHFLEFLNRYKQFKDKPVVPPSNCLTEAVNYNGLLYFLLANLLTGLINLSIRTIEMPAVQSVFILIAYMLILSGLSSILYHKKCKVKF